MRTSISQRNNYLTFILLLAGLFFAGTVAAEIQKFDMGSEQSPVWPGFTRVTETNVYSPENHYGWRKAPGQPLIHRHEHRYFDSLPDALTCDAVAPRDSFTGYYRAAMEFMLDLTNGEYGVYLHLGDYIGSRYEGSYGENVGNWPVSVTVEGEKKVGEKLLPEKWEEEVFYNLDGDYRKGDDDLWKKYIAPRFVPDRFDVKVTDGQLNLVFSNTPVSCLIVYPLAESQPAQAFIDELEKERRESFEKAMKDETPRPLEQMSDVTDVERERGYLWYGANYLDDIYPFDLPPPDRERKELKLFASQGEFEPVTFVVRPLRDLQECAVEAGELKGENGAVIKADCWDIRAVRYLECPKGYSVQTYIIRPAMLVKRGRFDMEEGINRRYWVTLHVPEDAQPGKYNGAITFRPKNASSVSIPVKVRILPFRLKPLEESERYHAVYWNYPKYGMTWPECLRDQSDHGINVIHQPPVPIVRLVDGKIEVDLTDERANVKNFLDMYRTNGFPMKLVVWQEAMNRVYDLAKEPKNDPELLKSIGRREHGQLKKSFSKEFESFYKQAARSIDAQFKANGWPEIYFYDGGEGASGGEWGIWTEAQLLKFLKEAGVKGTTSTIGLKALDAELPYMYAVNWAFIPLPGVNIAGFEKIMAAGIRLWVYGCYGWQIQTDDEKNKYGFHYTRYDRLLWGFWFWRSGAEGIAIEGYVGKYGKPFDEFDGRYIDEGLVVPSPQGPIPSPAWERTREGIDDSKYCAHLHSLINEAQKSKDEGVRKTAEKAKAVLDQIMSELPLDPARFKTEGRPGNNALDVWRWQIADQIIKLQNVMKIK